MRLRDLSRPFGRGSKLPLLSLSWDIKDAIPSKPELCILISYIMEKNTTFSKVAGLWKADKKQYVKKSTYAAYALLIQNHLLPELGEETDITEELVQALVNRKLESGLSQKTVRDILIVLKMILRFGVKYGYWELRQIDIHFPTERDKRDIEVLTLSNQRRLMTYVRENFTFLNLGIYICLSSGLRIGEICALKWDDIDVASGVIRVSRTLQRIYIVDGEAKSTELIEDSPKTKNSIREIPMTKELASMIKPLKKVVRGDFYVLTNGGSPTEPRTYRVYFKHLLEELDLPKMRFHGLRHSFATRCIESKCDYKTVSVLLGHSNISTTLNLYVHPNMEQKKKCIDAMYKGLK